MVLRRLADVLRGMLIGTAEVIPGVSGGTIALVVGVYADLIGSAGHLVRGVLALLVDLPRGRGTSRGRVHLREVRWPVVVPVLIGMAVALVVGAALVAPLVEEHPVGTRAVFAGLIVASLSVPARMIGWPWRPVELAAALVAAVLAFLLTGLPSAESGQPALPVVALAAAVAICALVLPGVSGSFLLLSVGMYAPTLAAVNERDLAYLGTFALGATVGLALFVSGLQWLLEHRRRLTLAVMLGLMLGSLRALWPWQDEDRVLQGPAGDVAGVVGLFALGLAVVVVLVLAESAVQRRQAAQLSERSMSGSR